MITWLQNATSKHHRLIFSFLLVVVVAIVAALGSLPFLGTDLRNDHPVSIIYETARAATTTEFVQQVKTGSKIQVGASNPLPLFGTTTWTLPWPRAGHRSPWWSRLG